MANIKVTLPVPLVDGHPVTFKAPAGCDTVTGIKVYYPSGTGTSSKVFSFRDANRNDISNLSNLFATGAYVRVVLDTVNSHAYIQNADTNQYLENRLEELLSHINAGLEALGTGLGGQLDALSAIVATAARSESGSYSGAGSMSKTLSFNFNPKLVVILQTNGGSQPYSYELIGGSSYGIYRASSTGSVTTKWDEKSVTVTNQNYAPNQSGVSYHYVAVG